MGRLWRYQIHLGARGIVVAESKEVAKQKIEKKYGIGQCVHLWDWAEDCAYDPQNPDVMEV